MGMREFRFGLAEYLDFSSSDDLLSLATKLPLWLRRNEGTMLRSVMFALLISAGDAGVLL